MLVYTSDDPVLALELESAGAAAVMPAGSPIGSGQGVINKTASASSSNAHLYSIIVDAGVGTASDVSIAMELGAEGCFEHRHRPRQTTRHDGPRHAPSLESGYRAARAGRIGMKRYANASPAMEGLITSPSGIVDDGIPGE